MLGFEAWGFAEDIADDITHNGMAFNVTGPFLVEYLTILTSFCRDLGHLLDIGRRVEDALKMGALYI